MSKTSTQVSGEQARSQVARAIAALRQQFGDRLSVGTSVRDQHGRGEAFARSFPPDAVVWPTNTAEVSQILKICNELRVPVIAFGAGTSLEGTCQRYMAAFASTYRA